MTGPNALILAGSGMLCGVAAHLAGDGWRVVMPSRRYTPLRVGEACSGKAVWVRADWTRPRELARDAERALTAPAALLVVWVHESYRRAVIGAVERLLADGAPVVEVRAVADLPPVPEAPEAPEPPLSGRPTQQVLLGAVGDARRRTGGRAEWRADRALRQDEIAGGVRQAVDRALRGRPSSLHHLGEHTLAHGH